MDVDFQMVRSLIEREKNERSRRRREGKNLDKCHFQKLDFEKKKKNVGSGSMCLVSFEREKKREREGICFERPPNYFPRSFLTRKIQLTSRFIEIYVAL